VCVASYIGQYEIVRELGAGAYGTVYLAEGEVPGKGVSGPRRRQVAVKKLHDPGDRTALEALQREFELLELVKHRSMTRVYEFLKAESAVVMEYVDGASLRDVIDGCGQRKEAVFTEAAIEIGCEMADCLYQAYSAPGKTGEPLQIVHRDLKPENIMLTPSGEVKILDFGLAKVNARHRRDDAHIKGTPLYMAPEQAQGKLTDHRTDLFALGLVLFELLLGRAAYTVPMDGKDPVAEVMKRIERAELRDQMRELESHLPDCGRVVNRLLQANPRARYENGHELMLDLRRHLMKERGTYLREFSEYYFTTIRPATARRGDARADAMSKPTSPPRPGPPGAPPSGPPRPGAPAGGPPRPGAPAGAPPRPGAPAAAAAPPRPGAPAGGPPRPGAPAGSPPRPGAPAGGPPRPGPAAQADEGPPPPPAGGPPRPGGAPPPPRAPGGPPAGLAKAGPAGQAPSRPTPGIPGGAAKPVNTPAAPPKPGRVEAAKKPDDMLQMQLVNDDEEESDQPVQSATQFFAIPTPKKGLKKPDAQGALAPPKPENTGGRALPGAGGGNVALIQGPANAPGQLGAAPLAIMGPVNGVMAGGQADGQGAGFSLVGPHDVADAEDGAGSSSSWKIYAIVLGLALMVGGALVVAIVVVVVGLNMQGKGAVAGDSDASASASADEEEPQEEAVADEPALEHKAAPAAPRKPRPAAPSGEKPAEAPPPAPKKATDTMRVAGVDEEFTKAQVQCDGYNKTKSLSGGEASFEDVPTSGSCKITFKGPAISVAPGVNGGKSYTCTVTATTAKCK
jgi:serine/threonine protein kinase